MKQKQNHGNARDDVYKMRCYSEDKQKAMQRAFEEGDSLGYLMACFLAGYAAGKELPLWIDDIQLEKREKSPV